MAEEQTPRNGSEHLAGAWWEAIDELRFIMNNAEDSAPRIAAATAILDYASKLNVGLGDPFIPDEPAPSATDEDEEN